MNIKEEIGKRIANARKQVGLTAKQLADRTVNLKPARIGNWEQGTRTPGVQEVKQIAKVLGVSPAYLFCLTDEENTAQKSLELPVIIPLLDYSEITNPKNISKIIQRFRNKKLEGYDHVPVGNNISDNMGPSTFPL